MAIERRLVEAYTAMATDRIAIGFTPYLLTLMFNPIDGNKYRRQEVMYKETQRLYAKLLTRMIRRPKKHPINELPFWIGCSDWPVPKDFKDHLFNIAQNDGQHIHIAAFQPPPCEIDGGLLNRIEDHQSHIHGPEHAFQRVHAYEITETPKKAVGYVLKSLSRRRIAAEDILVLPRAHSEMTTYAPFEREQLMIDAKERKAARLHAAYQAAKAQ